MNFYLIIFIVFAVTILIFYYFNSKKGGRIETRKEEDFDVVKSKKEWKEELSAEEYHILRQGGTEPPFDNEYFDNKKKGIYRCAGCGNLLFHSADKFDSGSGWPSFTSPVDDYAVGTRKDNRFLMTRTEAYCKRCGGHLGHVFNDGPEPTGLRYCINSGALNFEEYREE